DDAVTAREDAAESAVPGACGRRVQAPRIEGVLPLGDAVMMHVIAGGDPAPANVGDDTVGGALFTPEIDEVVTGIAAAQDAAVLLVAPCSGGVLDTDSGGMVRQFGASEGTAMNAVVDG